MRSYDQAIEHQRFNPWTACITYTAPVGESVSVTCPVCNAAPGERCMPQPQHPRRGRVARWVEMLHL